MPADGVVESAAQVDALVALPVASGAAGHKPIDLSLVPFRDERFF
jgi:hypothetical protein